MKKTGEKARKHESDDFKSVAKRLECDPSEERFDRALREIARNKLGRNRRKAVPQA